MNYENFFMDGRLNTQPFPAIVSFRIQPDRQAGILSNGVHPYALALVALSESKTLAELATEYRVHPTQIARWKMDLTKNASDLFGLPRSNYERGLGFGLRVGDSKLIARIYSTDIRKGERIDGLSPATSTG